MDTKEQRFVETEAQSGLRGVSVLVDWQTGVQYLFVKGRQCRGPHPAAGPGRRPLLAPAP